MERRYLLICASGYQRSGTTVLFNSLAAKNRQYSFNESPDSEAFTNKKLSSQAELMPLARRCGGKLIVKPNKLFSMFTLEEIVRRYSNFDIKIVWSFRNPVNVYSSHFQMVRGRGVQEHGESEFDQKIVNGWKERNSAILNGLKYRVLPILLVQYEKLIESYDPGQQIARFTGLEYTHRHKKKYDHDLGNQLPQAVSHRVRDETRDIFEELVDVASHQWRDVGG